MKALLKRISQSHPVLPSPPLLRAYYDNQSKAEIHLRGVPTTPQGHLAFTKMRTL